MSGMEKHRKRAKWRVSEGIGHLDERQARILGLIFFKIELGTSAVLSIAQPAL
jgi:hypothetical protein